MSLIYTPESTFNLNSPFVSIGSPYVDTISPLIVSERPILTTTTPYLPSVNVGYSYPTLSFYEDLSSRPDIQKRLVKYYYYKVLDKWLFSDLIDILNYFTVKDNRVDIIKSKLEYNPTTVDKDSNDIIQKKINFIEKVIFSTNDIYKIIKKYVQETGTRWVDLPKNEFFLRQVIEDELKRKIRKAMKR
jgi:hypothetical protein